MKKSIFTFLLSFLAAAPGFAQTLHTSAPKPGKSAASVKSVYSDAYPSQVPNMFIGSWYQKTVTSSVDLVSGDKALYNTNFNYLGIEFGNNQTMINATDMQYLHLDVYPEASFTMNVYPISKYSDGTTNDQVSKAVSLQANKWNQIDIPLSDFNGLDLSKIFQFKFTGGNGQNFYLDNIYFYTNNTQEPSDDYQLVWSDEFDSNSLGTNWNVEVNGDGGGNNEMQYYTNRDKNIKIKNGNLVITAYRENYSGKSFTSGRVNTQGKVTFTHGKIEASIKLPNLANGLWPAFWMLGDDIYTKGWPYCGEIDIMEMGEAGGIRSGKQNSWVGGTIHWGTAWNDAPYYSDKGQHDIGYNLAGDGKYHKFTCVWDENFINMYVDDSPTPYMTAAIGQTSAPGEYLHKPNFIVFNMAVGGGFPQIYDANGITALPNNGSNATMYVDYVRVYQKDKNIKFVENDAASTGISNVKAEKKDSSDIYNINGQLVRPTAANTNNLPNGIYIWNGKKILVK